MRRLVVLLLLMVLIPSTGLAQPESFYTALDLRDIGDTEGALAAFRDAHRTSPADSDVVRHLGRMLFEHRPEEYRKFVLQDLRTQQGPGEVLNLVRSHPRSGLVERFLELEAESEHPGVVLWRAERRLDRGEKDRAREDLIRLIDTDLTSVDRKLRLAWLLGELGKAAPAVRLLSDLRREHPEHPLVHLGIACWGPRDDVEHQRSYNRFRALTPGSVSPEFSPETLCSRGKPPVSNLGWLPESG